MSGRGMDPEKSRQLVDTIRNEHLKRLNWFAANYERLASENRKPRKKLTDGILWEALEKKRSEAFRSSPRYTKVKTPQSLPERDSTVILEPMKPVPPEVHALIYQGISHEDGGAKGYLKVRYKEDPDDKFYMIDCSNWVYGYGINSFELNKLTRIPRIQIIQSTFYRRGGVERDPDHYRDAVKTEAPMFFPTL